MALAFDHLAPAAYPDDLYAVDAEVTPIPNWDAFTTESEAQYRALGFVSIARAIPDEAVTGIKQAFLDLIMAPAVPAGVELQYESAGRGVVESLEGDERSDYVRKLMWFTRHDARFTAVAEDPALLSVVERLLGAKPELFQDMALFKPPGIGREKPWHQDHAYFNIPLGTPVVGVWIALDETSLANGCMVFRPGGHREGPLPHFNRRDWQICDSEVLGRTGNAAVPLPAGGCVVFDGLTPHGTPANRSDRRRRALQFHYIPAGTPRITTEERTELFGEGAHNASC